MKKILSLILVVMCLFSATSIYAKSEVVKDNNDLKVAIKKIEPQYVKSYNALTASEKENRLMKISTSYKEGDVLSEEDSAFILLNREEIVNTPDVGIRAGSSSNWYDKYKTQYGVRVNLYGTMKQDIAFIAGSSRFGGTASLRILEGSASKVKLEIFHTAYGLIGTSAPFVGVLYNGSVSMSKDNPNSTTKMDKEKEYGSILPIYTTMYSRGTVTTDDGDEFTILSDTWKKFH